MKKMDNFFPSDSNDLGFMDLLGLQDYGSFVFDDEFVFLQQSGDDFSGNRISAVDSCFKADHHHKVVLPSTPNSSSVSSLSCEVINNENEKQSKIVEEHVDEHDDEHDDDNDEQEQQMTKKELKAKRTNNQKKKQRGARFAFMTKSEVDHLEDGYRWRKYGQKAVKNSPFPRSYYRCTSATCGVKKRVERSCDDPAIVMTTYEGQHTHPSPITPRCRTNNYPTTVFPGCSAFFSGGQQPTFDNIHLQQQQQQQPLVHNHHHHHSNLPSALNLPYGGTQNYVFCRDNGLLQDIIPSFTPKEEK